jgi:predicted transglutaminase-like cysteine proteinase
VCAPAASYRSTRRPAAANRNRVESRGRRNPLGSAGAARRWIAALLLAPAWLAAAAADFARLESLAEQRYGPPALATLREWRALLGSAAARPEAERLRAANDFFNERVAVASDAEVWGESDYWATPLETLGRRRGDCEDFSIAKYATLLLLGIPAHQLRLVYVKAAIGGPTSQVSQAHMVLAYYARADAEPLILDSLLGEVLPASRRPDLAPVFSFNSEGLWVGAGSTATDTKPERRLSRWAAVLLRMQQDGLRWSSGEAP